MKKQSVILGGKSRVALITARELSKLGLKIYVLSDTNESIARFSKSIKNFIIIKNIFSKDIYEIKDEIFNKTKHLKGSFFVPIDDLFLALVEEFFDDFKENFVIPYSNKESISKIVDKWNIYKEAKKAGFDVPQSQLIRDLAGISGVNIKIFPVIVKPVRSFIIKDGKLYGKNKVYISKNWEELQSSIRLLIQNVQVILQEYLPGYGVGINFLAENGSIINHFHYKREHEPLLGGGSTLRESLPVNNYLLNKSQVLLKELSYTGVGMIEFRFNPEKERFYMMEINARFWGSLSLPVFCGLNFPQIAYNYFVKGEKSATSNYRTGYYSRNLKNDFFWLASNLKQVFHEQKSVLALMKFSIKYTIFLFKKHLSRKETFDIEKLSDPIPAFHQIFSVFSKRINNKINRIGQIFGKALLNIKREQIVKKFIKKIQENNNDICFICKGNINRSPFAVYYYFTKNGNNKKVTSAGFHHINNKMPPFLAVKVAKKYGADISNYKSNTLLSLEVRKNTTFIVMEYSQYSILKRMFPDDFVIPLGIFLKNKRFALVDITDPSGKSEKVYEECFQLISSAIDKMVERTSFE